MPIPQNKQELLVAIDLEYGKLLKAFSKVSTDGYRKVELDGHAKHTKMSIHNLMSYLLGWAELVLKWYNLYSSDKEIDFPEAGFKWTELGLLAQKFYQDYEELDTEEVNELLDTKLNQIKSVIQSLSNEDLYKEPFYKHYPFGRMIQLNTSSPYKNASTRIRHWLKHGH